MYLIKMTMKKTKKMMKTKAFIILTTTTTKTKTRTMDESTSNAPAPQLLPAALVCTYCYYCIC